MNHTEAEVTTLKQNVGTCPACRAYLWAEVDVTVALGKPELDGLNKVRVSCRPVLRGMRLVHECERDEYGRPA